MTKKYGRFFLLGYQYSSNISQPNEHSNITYMDSIKNSNNYYHIPRTTTEKSATTEYKTGDITVAEIEVAIKAWDHHIERLEAKLSFLIRSYDDPRTDLLYQYEKKIATVKQEINDATEQKRTLNRLRQMSVIRYSIF
jgi:hypothetical protein